MSVIAIVGVSGAGKTTLAEFAGKALGIPVICSYTTRPMREGETDGKEHWFVTENDMPPREQMLAYTYFGGHHYWTLKSQLADPCIYVVDEEGLRMLWRQPITLFSIYIYRDAYDIPKERYERDYDRKSLPMSSYDYIYRNYRSLERMLVDLTKIIEECI